MSVRRVRFQKLAGYFSTIFPASNVKAYSYMIDIIIGNIIDLIGNIIDLIGSDVKSLTFCTLCKHLCIQGPRPPFSTYFWFLSNQFFFLPQPCSSNVASSSFPFCDHISCKVLSGAEICLLVTGLRTCCNLKNLKKKKLKNRQNPLTENR